MGNSYPVPLYALIVCRSKIPHNLKHDPHKMMHKTSAGWSSAPGNVVKRSLSFAVSTINRIVLGNSALRFFYNTFDFYDEIGSLALLVILIHILMVIPNFFVLVTLFWKAY